jgi:hypothetical protein
MVGEMTQSTGSSATKFLMVVAILAVAISLISFISNYASYRASGFASVDTGTANLTILSKIDINFTVWEVNWGTGYVNVTDGEVNATLNTEGVMEGTGWDHVTQGLVLESLSNQNVTINLTSSNDALGFIDTDSDHGSTYMWKITEEESGSCGSNGVPGSDLNSSLLTYKTVANVATYPDGVIICDNFYWGQSANELLIDIEVNVSADALPGERGSIITATAAVL